MSNELVFIISALANTLFILLVARRGLDWLLGTIVVNLILIGIFGAKLIVIFGLTTNAGNVFYACVFLATYFIIERYGQKNALKTIWFGIAFSVFFILMSQLATNFHSLESNSIVNEALLRLFSFSPRVILASIIGYFFAQYVNIIVYQWIKKRTKNKFLWFRINLANILGQLVDSLLFFSIAFFDLPGPLLIQAILAGWFVKILVVLLGTPFLYMDAPFKNKKNE